MLNMRNEFGEEQIKNQAIQTRSRNSIRDMRRGSNASMMSQGRKSMRDRKSVVTNANENLSRFSLIDIDKSSDLKKLKEREVERKSRLDVLNRRLSISSPNLVPNLIPPDDAPGPIGTLTIPVNRQRRLSLCVPDQDELGGNGGRRVSIGGRRNSTVFNFDPRQLPNTKDADLFKQPKKSALRRPSYFEPD